jgi:hypothetical protein
LVRSGTIRVFAKQVFQLRAGFGARRGHDATDAALKLAAH